jgi:hypothetical protein
MSPTAKPILDETRGASKPGPAAALWFGIARVVSFCVLVVVLSLFVAPGKAQAHGLHGSPGVIAANAADVDATGGAAKAEALGGSEVSEANCITCCATSGCGAVSVPETFELFDAGPPKSGFHPASTVAAYQMARYGLRRPPRQTA